MALAIGMSATVAICALFFPQHSRATDPVAPARIALNYGKLPLSFEANNGQMDSRLSFDRAGTGTRSFSPRMKWCWRCREQESCGIAPPELLYCLHQARRSR